MIQHWSALRNLARRVDERPTGWLTANAVLLAVLFWVILVPSGRHHILMPLLALASGLGMLRALAAPNDAIGLRSMILTFAAAGSIPVALGALRDTPGWIDVAIPLVGGPIAWFAIAHLMDSRSRDLVAPVIAAATIVITVLMMTLVLGVFRGPARLLQPGSSGALLRGFARTNHVAVNSLISTVPLLATLCYDRWRYRIDVPRARLILAGLIVGLVGVAISGRQGVIGAAVMTPLLIAATSRLGFRPDSNVARPKIGKKTLRPAVAALVAAAVVASLLGLSPTRLTSEFFDALPVGESAETSRVTVAAGIRSRQADSFLTGFGERPIFGWGAGAVSPEFPTWRGYEIGTEFTMAPRPWRAEMSYHLLLFEGGLVAVAGYLAATLASVVMLRRRFRSLPLGLQSLVRAAIVASIAVAIASAFNPLTRSVGQQWPLFLPVFLVAGHSVVASKQSVMAPATSDGSQES